MIVFHVLKHILKLLHIKQNKSFGVSILKTSCIFAKIQHAKLDKASELTITINYLHDYVKFFELCQREKIDEQRIIIKFNLKFVNPSDVLLISQFAIAIANKKDSIKITVMGRTELIDYMTDIGLSEFLATNCRQPSTIDFIAKQSAMPIRRVEQDKIEEYVIKTMRYLGNICINKDLTVLSTGIKESINNVHDHANSDIGAYVFCQYYPKIKIIKLCVSDLGCGIAEVVRRKFPDSNNSDMECLRWALKENNTTKSRPNNAGKGLSTIRSFTKETKGELRIRTGECFYQMKNGVETFCKNSIKSFKGTLIEIDINISELEELEEEMSGSFHL